MRTGLNLLLNYLGIILLSWMLSGAACAYTFMKKPFQKHYDLKLVSCSTCHLKGEKKDLVNEFGETIQKLLADTDVPAQMQVCKEADEETKDRIKKKLAEEFTVVLKRLDELKAPSGKTYAQAIRDGEIAGAKPKKPGDNSKADETESEADEDEDEDGEK